MSAKIAKRARLARAIKPSLELYMPEQTTHAGADELRAWTLHRGRAQIVDELAGAAERWRDGDAAPALANERLLMARVIWPAIDERLGALAAAPSVAAWCALLELLASAPPPPWA